ncbi:MAG TPA: UDP-2,3-diacylglucosamine diphosphatase [Steroidobacteraceae bacterium]|nr:UDP-2,3-diacylglucosamine diphosphatase [Steroidobacteraceae bacterium]
MSSARHSLFASDLHLDSEAPWAIDAFLAFLDGPARAADALYLLGDLFEVWVGDDDDNPDNARACAGLARLTAAGVPVFALHGNRDFLLGEAFAQRTGVKLLPDPVLFVLHDVPTLLSHGDVFCTGDTSYQELRSIVRRPAWQRRFLALPLAARRELASAARAGSKAHTQRTIPTIMDVDPEAVSQAMRATGARRLIHGHTHRPAVHPFVVDGVSSERVVLAPWYEAASCVAVDGGGIREVSLPR